MYRVTGNIFYTNILYYLVVTTRNLENTHNILLLQILLYTPITNSSINFVLTVFILFFQFDTYVKSLNIEPQAPMFRIVTDGQLPIRQCLHRESSIKDIELPEYYNVFHDLRKDFSKFYNAPQDQTFNSITDLVNCILLYYYIKKKFFQQNSSSLLPVSRHSQ